ncbi:unnamed protein product [Lymnaea stagnalis]|uniref:Uncharacterized protein n=1 Tax=Lymnaea stagnalis TaxID=6523 RepID=A0AAV2I830_LYMST
MTSMELKTRQEIDEIIHMVLFQEKDPLEDDGEIDEEEQADAGVESDQQELFRKRCGQILGKMGDEFYKEKAKGQADVQEQLQQSQVQEVINALSEANSWEKFKEVIDSSTEGTVVGDSYKTLGSLILVLHGLRSLGEGTKNLAARLARRYVSEAKLDKDIARMGGLPKFLADNLD